MKNAVGPGGALQNEKSAAEFHSHGVDQRLTNQGETHSAGSKKANGDHTQSYKNRLLINPFTILSPVHRLVRRQFILKSLHVKNDAKLPVNAGRSPNIATERRAGRTCGSPGVEL